MAIDGVLRIKGVVGLYGKGASLAVQAVGPRVETGFVRDGEDRKLGLVVIGLKGLNRNAVERILGGGA
jgi:cobalamin biosynthesis protein CobW